MSVTAKDFIAEAGDIEAYLTPYINSVDLARYVQQRCATLFQHNALFDRDMFTAAAYGLADKPEGSITDEIRESGISQFEAMERTLILRSVLDIHRVVPFRCTIERDYDAPEIAAWSYRLAWRGPAVLSTSMRDAFSVIRSVHHG
jgi:hypothetical protein